MNTKTVIIVCSTLALGIYVGYQLRGSGQNEELPAKPQEPSWGKGLVFAGVSGFSCGLGSVVGTKMMNGIG